MSFQHPYIQKLTPDDERQVLIETERVLHAVFDHLGADADPAEVKKLYTMLKPGDPHEFGYVTLGEAK